MAFNPLNVTVAYMCGLHDTLLHSAKDLGAIRFHLKKMLVWSPVTLYLDRGRGPLMERRFLAG